MNIPNNVFEIARGVALLLMDCDGVLTDGRLFFTDKGELMKAFHVRDGQGIQLWHAAGFSSGIISGRDSGGIIRARAEELGIRYLHAGSRDKVLDFEMIISDAGLEPSQVAYIGDDVGDLGLMSIVGLPVAVGDALPSVKAEARYVTSADGGNGAVRELCELLLAAKSAKSIHIA